MSGLVYPEDDTTRVGKHSDELRLEDQPSRNIATGEAWWRPRHVAMRGCRTWPTPPWCKHPCRPGGICAP